MQTLYAAGLGIKMQQHRVSTIANNIANINTTGFKSQRVSFKDALYTRLINPANTASAENLRQGAGVLIASTSRDFTLGNPQNTGNSLDLYIDGNGFFTIKDNGGGIMYTRGGCFGISSEADGRYLVTAQGNYLLDTDNNRISVPANTEQITVSPEGLVAFDGAEGATLQIVDFVNKEGLTARGNGCYTETDVSGPPVKSSARIAQGVMESSNVDLAVELSMLVRAQRAFSLAGRAVSVWDQMASNANNIR
ncbi:MAG: flagellar hook-basal body complex protein [Christensenellales bacterium]